MAKVSGGRLGAAFPTRWSRARKEYDSIDCGLRAQWWGKGEMRER